MLDALHADRLRDGVVDACAAGFVRAEAAAGLGFEFEGVALFFDLLVMVIGGVEEGCLVFFSFFGLDLLS